MATILKNGCNFGSNSARCTFIVLIESSDDFEQLIFQAFFFYLFTKQGQEQFFIYNMRLWRPFWKMAAVAATGQIHDGPISKFVRNTLFYLFAKFGAFIKNCTIGQLTRPTITKHFKIISSQYLSHIILCTQKLMLHHNDFHT